MVLSSKAPVSLLQVQYNVIDNESPSLESSKYRLDSQVFDGLSTKLFKEKDVLR